MPRLIGIIQIALASVLIIGLVTGCEVLSPTSTPDITPEPTLTLSEYPADISGHVIVAEKVKCLTLTAVPPNEEGDIFWIVDITVKNNAYTDPVEADFQMGYKGWVITANDKAYMPVCCGSSEENPTIDLTVGQTGQFMLHFIVPQTLQINDSQICYQGQEPYSYGKLTGGDKVVAYDWGSKTAIEETKEDAQDAQYFVKKEVTGHKKVGEMGNIDITEPVYEDVYTELRTVVYEKKSTALVVPTSVTGEEYTDWYIEFSATQAPWVVNWNCEFKEYNVLDPVESKATFSVRIFTSEQSKFLYSDPFRLIFGDEGEDRGISDKGVHCIVVHEPGDYVIVLRTNDAEHISDWWLKIGVE